MSRGGSFDSLPEFRPRWAQGVCGRGPGARPSEGVGAPEHRRPESQTASTRGSTSAPGRGRADWDPGWGQSREHDARGLGRCSPSPGARRGGPGPGVQVRFARVGFSGLVGREGQPGTRAQSPPRSGAGPLGIRPAARPRQGVISVTAQKERCPVSAPGVRGSRAPEGVQQPGKASRGWRVRRRAAPRRGCPRPACGPARAGTGWSEPDSLRVGKGEANTALIHRHLPGEPPEQFMQLRMYTS